MFRTLLLVSALFSVSALAQTDIPKTPAGQALTAWLDAFNSGDPARLEAFVKAWEPKHPDRFMESPGFMTKPAASTSSASTAAKSAPSASVSKRRTAPPSPLAPSK